MDRINQITKLLPGYNCRACGYKRCDQFALCLSTNECNLSQCPILKQPHFQHIVPKITQLINSTNCKEQHKSVGLIDNIEADFILHPLSNEQSCREVLVKFFDIVLVEGEIVRYRPLGCPIIHFAKILSINHGLLTVHIVGPCKRLNNKTESKDLGICMVVSFSGRIEGKIPTVGQTVKFLPKHCMMGKVHSGVIVNMENENVTIDCIDLKVWEHSKRHC